MLKAVLLSTAALALIATSADAGPAIVPHSGLGQGVPAGHVPGAYVVSTIDKSEVGAYFYDGGFLISGPTSPFHKAYGAAEQFIPSANATVSKIVAALGYYTGSHNVTLTLYSDSGNNTPGQILVSGTATIPAAAASCCALTTATIPTTNLTAGTPVWIGITAGDSDYDEVLPQVKNEVNDYHYVSFTSDGGSTWNSAYWWTGQNPAVGLK